MSVMSITRKTRRLHGLLQSCFPCLPSDTQVSQNRFVATIKLSNGSFLNSCNCTIHETYMVSHLHTSSISFKKEQKHLRIRPRYSELRKVCIIVTNDEPIDKLSELNNKNYLTEIEQNIIACSTHRIPKVLKQTNKVMSPDYEVESFGSLCQEVSDNEGKENKENTRKPFKPNAVIAISDNAKTVEEWRKVVDQILETCKDYSKSFVLTSLMELFFQRVSINIKVNDKIHTSPLVQTYLNYLVSNDDVLSLSQPSLTCYVSHCMSNNDCDMIVSLYQRLHKRVKVFNERLLNMFISASHRVPFESTTYDSTIISDLMKKANQYGSLGLLSPNKAISEYGAGAFKRNDPETGISIFLHILEKAQFCYVDNRVLSAFLQHYSYTTNPQKWKESYEVVQVMFNHLSVNSVLLTKASVRSIAHWFQSIENQSWSLGCFSNYEIKRGRCPVSQVRMKQSNLTANEYTCLKEEVLRLLLKEVSTDVNPNVVKKYFAKDSDIFHLTSVKHFTKFLAYLHDEGPFDLLVDGMNLVHCIVPKSKKFLGKHRFKDGLFAMEQVILEYRRRPGNKNKKICIVFREHMRKHVKLDSDILFDIADVYFTEINSADDTYILYGAISSGPNCHFVSHDLFRDYRYKAFLHFKTDLSKIFDKYQHSRQTFVQGQRNKYISRSVAYDPVIQKTSTTWHFPYFASNNESSRLPQNWLCATTKQDVPYIFFKRAEELTFGQKDIIDEPVACNSFL